MTRKNLTAALLAGFAGTAGMVSVSDAVNVNPDGLGQALIFPYYTTRNDQDTLISVVNTSDQVKGVKVRVIDGKGSQEVLDFNLYLSPFDVWTARIFDNGTGGAISTFDQSCTAPNLLSRGAAGEPFRNVLFAGDKIADNSLDRTREGYVEIISMLDLDEGSTFGALAVHGSDGVPANCNAIRGLWQGSGAWTSNSGLQGPADPASAPASGLYGTAYVVDMVEGTAFTYSATALEGWTGTIQHTEPGSTFPSLAQVNDGPGPLSGQATARVFDAEGQFRSALFTTRQGDAVSAVFMHDTVMNDYVVNPDLGAGTDMVFTMPTKRFHVPQNGATPFAPFTVALGANGSCEPVGLQHWDMEEQTPGGPELDFSPRPPDAPGPCLPWEVTVVEVEGSSAKQTVLASGNAVNLPLEFDQGWLRVRFNDSGHVLTSDDGVTFEGLPVIGFAAMRFIDGDISDGVLANYTGLFNHKATRSITSS